MGYKKDDMIPTYIRKFPKEWDIKTKYEDITNKISIPYTENEFCSSGERRE